MVSRRVAFFIAFFGAIVSGKYKYKANISSICMPRTSLHVIPPPLVLVVYSVLSLRCESYITNITARLILKFEFHEIPVDFLTINNEHSAHGQEIGTGNRESSHTQVWH